jgi:hypothetical protein
MFGPLCKEKIDQIIWWLKQLLIWMYVYVSWVQKLSEYGQDLFIKILLYQEDSKTNISWKNIINLLK